MERLGMLRGVRMASVGAFVLIRRMLRLICGRRFALITVAMAIVVAYQLADDLFISYGTVGADSLLGIDLPPLFMAAMTMGGSEAFALLLPLALLADSAWSFRNGYLSLLVARGVDSVRLSLSCMAAFMIATVLSFAVVALVTGAVCALVCSGSFETELINMADTDFAPMLSWGAAGSAGLIALQLVSCFAIAAVTGSIALAVPARSSPWFSGRCFGRYSGLPRWAARYGRAACPAHGPHPISSGSSRAFLWETLAWLCPICSMCCSLRSRW